MMITIADVVKQYGSITAVDHVNLIFENNTVTALMGENGAGKSTLLKMCTGILSLDHGNIIIDGHSIQTHPVQAKQELGYLPEMPYMYDRLTGREFLLYIASLREIHNAHALIDEYVQRLGMQQFLDYEIGTYSKGMKQKISIITALMHQPANLLLDEPVWGLDPLTSRTLQDFIAKRKGTTVVATHSPDLVEHVANVVYVMKQGRILHSGHVPKLIKGYGSIEDMYFAVGDKKSC